MYTKYISKFEMGKKLEIAVCNVQKMEKIQKKHVQWLITQPFLKIYLKNFSDNGIIPEEEFSHDSNN